MRSIGKSDLAKKYEKMKKSSKDINPLYSKNNTVSDYAHRNNSNTTIDEKQATCNTCGHVWYFTDFDVMQETNKALKNVGKSLLSLGGSHLAGVLPDEKVNELSRCPRCGSRKVTISR